MNMTFRNGFIIIFILVLVVFYKNHQQYKNNPVSEVDEAAWIFSSYYYRLAFLERDFTHKDWLDFDAIDHPPLAKYIFGAAIDFVNQTPDSLENKKWWHEIDLDLKNAEKNIQIMRDRINSQSLQATRLTSTVFFAVASVVLYLTASLSFNPICGVITTVLFVFHPIVLSLAQMTMADGLFLALMLVTVCLQIQLFNKICRNGSGIYHAISLGVAQGLLFSTKILGAASVPIAAISILLTGCVQNKIKNNKIKHSHFLFSILAMFVSFLLVTQLINPSLWHDPLRFIETMFTHRLNRVALQMSVFYWHAVPSTLLSLSLFVRKILFEGDPVFGFFGVPVLVFWFVLGFWQSLAKTGYSGRVMIPVMNACFWGGISIWTYKLNWSRYFLPSLPFVCLFTAYGAHEFFISLSRRILKINRVRVFAILFFVSALFIFQREYTWEYYKKKHSDWFLNAEAQHIQNHLRFHPGDADMLYRLAELEYRLGCVKNAKKIWQTHFQLVKGSW